MSFAASAEITEFLRERAGEYLRSAVHYDGSGFEVVYLREDVSEQYTAGEIEEVIEDLRWESFEKSHQEALYVHGDLRCNVRCFDDAVEMHFPHDDRSGTAIALDPEVIAELYSFVDECLGTLERSR